jgi:PIN domain nuclease of toxin-antitoxin system
MSQWAARIGKPWVIVLDTHIWVWWVSQAERLSPAHRAALESGPDRVFAVSIMTEDEKIRAYP